MKRFLARASALALLGLAALAPAAAADPVQLANVGGQIIDATPTRVLYYVPDAHADPHVPDRGHLHISDFSSPGPPVDETIAWPTGQMVPKFGSDGARLIPGGALYPTSPLDVGSPVNIHEWHNGTDTDRGLLNGFQSVVVAGNYAIWSNGQKLNRLNLLTEAVDVVSENAVNDGNDIAASGDVFYTSSDYKIHRWHAPLDDTVLSTPTSDRSTFPRSDGTTTVFRHTRIDPDDQSSSLLFNDSGGEHSLPNSLNTSQEPLPGRDYSVNGGWIAYTGSVHSQLWTRSPAGAETNVDGGATILIRGVNPDGQVIYERGTAFLLRNGTANPFPVDTGGSEAWHAFWSGDHWYVWRGTVLSRLDVDTAIITKPPAVTSSHTAHFELASTDANPVFTCTLDGNPQDCPDGEANLTGVPDGEHTFTASADGDTTAATYTWTVDSTHPDGFALASPADNAYTGDATPQLSWGPGSSAGIVSYQVKLDGNVVATNSASETTFTPSTALPDGSHTWQVIAKNSADTTSASPIRHFTVDTVFPSVPELDAPANDAKTSSARPTLSWSQSTDSLSGMAGYDVEIDGVSAHVGNGVGSFTPGADLSDGNHDWRVFSVDGAGNRTSSLFRRVIVNTGPPVAHISAAPNPTVTGQSVHFEAGATSPGGAAPSRYEWDLDDNGTYETDTGATSSADETYVTPQDLDVRVRVTDTAGRTGTALVAVRVAPAPLPGPPGITINDGAQFTNDRSVEITARWPFYATTMLVSNDGGFGGAEPTAVDSSFDWELNSSGTERLPKTVYVRFSSGNETYSDDIILDETAPTILSATLRPAAKRRYVAHVRGRDAVSGLKYLQVTSKRSHAGARHHYTRTLVVSSSHAPRWTRVIDRAGNRSKWRKLKRLR